MLFNMTQSTKFRQKTFCITFVGVQPYIDSSSGVTSALLAHSRPITVDWPS